MNYQILRIALFYIFLIAGITLQEYGGDSITNDIIFDTGTQLLLFCFAITLTQKQYSVAPPHFSWPDFSLPDWKWWEWTFMWVWWVFKFIFYVLWDFIKLIFNKEVISSLAFIFVLYTNKNKLFHKHFIFLYALIISYGLGTWSMHDNTLEEIPKSNEFIVYVLMLLSIALIFAANLNKKYQRLLTISSYTIGLHAWALRNNMYSHDKPIFIS